MRPHLTDMTNNSQEAEEQTTPAAYHQAMMCTRQAGKAIIRVVSRCEDAKENENLGMTIDFKFSKNCMKIHEMSWSTLSFFLKQSSFFSNFFSIQYKREKYLVRKCFR